MTKSKQVATGLLTRITMRQGTAASASPTRHICIFSGKHIRSLAECQTANNLQKSSFLLSPRSPSLFVWPSVNDVTVRGLAIKKSRGKFRKTESKEALPLMNEMLVKTIMDESIESSPEKVKLRLVIEKNSETPPESVATTLSDAIRKALDLGLDLVAIDLNHELPVVRAVKYEAKLYRANKEKAKAPKDPSSIVKEFRFKAKIEDNDFSRKIRDVLEALKKGHKCKILARCPRRMVGPNNPSGAGEVIERVMGEIGSAGEATKPPEINVEKTQASVLLVPSKA